MAHHASSESAARVASSCAAVDQVRLEVRRGPQLDGDGRNLRYHDRAAVTWSSEGYLADGAAAIRVHVDVHDQTPRCTAAEASALAADAASDTSPVTPFHWISRTMWQDRGAGASYAPTRGVAESQGRHGAAETNVCVCNGARGGATQCDCRGSTTPDSKQCATLGAAAPAPVGHGGAHGASAHFDLAQAAATAQLQHDPRAHTLGRRLPRSPCGASLGSGSTTAGAFRTLPTPVRRMFSPCESTARMDAWDGYSTSDGGTPGSTASSDGWSGPPQQSGTTFRRP